MTNRLIRTAIRNRHWIAAAFAASMLRGAEMRKFLDEDNAQTRAFLVDIGLAK